MTAPSSTDFADPRHPHEPDVAPVLDAEGRCLVCGCQWRDAQIAQLKAEIHELVKHLRAHNPDCGLLPENITDNPGWESEAHHPCTHNWHETRTVKRADFCPVCGEPNHDPSRPNG